MIILPFNNDHGSGSASVSTLRNTWHKTQTVVLFLIKLRWAKTESIYDIA